MGELSRKEEFCWFLSMDCHLLFSAQMAMPLFPRCPFEGDNYRTQMVPMGPATSQLQFPDHYQRFTIATFTFVDSAHYMVLDGLVRDRIPTAAELE